MDRQERKNLKRKKKLAERKKPTAIKIEVTQEDVAIADKVRAKLIPCPDLEFPVYFEGKVTYSPLAFAFNRKLRELGVARVEIDKYETRVVMKEGK